VQVVPIVAEEDHILDVLAVDLEGDPTAAVVVLGKESLGAPEEDLAAAPSHGLEEDPAEIAETAVEEVDRTLAGEDRRREVVLEEDRTT
jgi:hypothetical protein